MWLQHILCACINVCYLSPEKTRMTLHHSLCSSFFLLKWKEKGHLLISWKGNLKLAWWENSLFSLGLHVRQSTNGIFISQTKYTKELLKSLELKKRKFLGLQWVLQQAWKLMPPEMIWMKSHIEEWLIILVSSCKSTEHYSYANVPDSNQLPRSHISLQLNELFVTWSELKISVSSVPTLTTLIYLDIQMLILRVIKQIIRALVALVKSLEKLSFPGKARNKHQ